MIGVAAGGGIIHGGGMHVLYVNTGGKPKMKKRNYSKGQGRCED